MLGPTSGRKVCKSVLDTVEDHKTSLVPFIKTRIIFRYNNIEGTLEGFNKIQIRV